ncbi:MAG TPA: carbon-nitrogen hydrolase family protein [Verrucomicrobiae bacterium]|nr:carbon-nitrogen hydrolase family protein [Verrucomicrobiae bacterium]
MPRTTLPLKSRLHVAAAQMKFAPTIDENLARIEAALHRAAARGADAILFPECATTGYAYPFETLNRGQIREALLAVGTLAAKYGIHVLLGTPFFRGRKLFNGLVVFNRAGEMVHAYAKCQLTEADRRVFTPGNSIALFELDGVPCTAIICHERRYPELVRLAVMAGARVLFHPNAGMDALAVSKRKRGGKDGIAVRAFENAIFYVFANSVGPQGAGKWSAGDSKIVAPDGTVLALADNRSAALIHTTLDLAQATGKYAKESLEHPRFLSAAWKRMVRLTRRQASDKFARLTL